MSASFFNKLWLSQQSKFADEFHLNAGQIKSFQASKLRHYLEENSNTEFGKKHDFSSIRNYEDYKQAVPILEDYSDYKSYIDQIAAGKSNILFPGKPLFFETTSGTSKEVKLIAYNKELKKEFAKAVATWMHDLNRLNPKIFSGKSYWSLSPALKNRDISSGGIRIGTSNDSDYFDPLSALFLNQIFAVPNQISRITDPHKFYLHTWSHLLTTKKLTFLSVWSPQFLIRLVDFFKENLREICNKSGATRAWTDYIMGHMNDGTFTLSLIFPDLQMISCWTQGQSKIWLKKLLSLSGVLPIQGKGLLSTEGVVSIPIGMDKQVLSYTSHFYEFKGSDTSIYTAVDLIPDNIYEVIITTGGGLYRYNTHDLVRCTGFYNAIPCLEFLGRSGQNSDLVGEKISETSLLDLFNTVLDHYTQTEALYLYAVKSEITAGYLLIIESDYSENDEKIKALVESGLKQNPYYAQAIQSGQLQDLQSKSVAAGFSKILTAYYQKIKKIKDGDLKLPVLFPLNFLDELLNVKP